MFINSLDVLLTTCILSGHEYLFNTFFEYVIVYEAGQCSELTTIVPITNVKCKNVVFKFFQRINACNRACVSSIKR